MMNFFAQMWHKCQMNHNYVLYKECLDPQMKKQFSRKVSYHSSKVDIGLAIKIFNLNTKK